MFEKKTVDEASPPGITLPGNAYCVRSLQQTETGQIVLRTSWVTAQAATSSHRQRIAAEVAALQAVEHPCFVPPQEVQVRPQGVCLLSSLPTARPLDEYLRERFLQPLPHEEALSILRQLGQALAALHRQGRTHGHLTPHTIWVGATGQVFLTEARMNSILQCLEHYQPALDEQCPRCWYMAPEQFHGTCRPQSDQYALGCLAYQLFTGHLPFPGTARATLLQKHYRDLPKPLTHFHPALPTALDAAVRKALAKLPGERHDSVPAFLEALAEETSHREREQEEGTTTIWSQQTFPLPTAAILAPLPATEVSEQPEQAVEHELGHEISETSTAPLPIAAKTWASLTPHLAPPLRASSASKQVIALALGFLLLLVLGTLGGWGWMAAGQAAHQGHPVHAGAPIGPGSQAQGQAPATVGPSLTPSVAPLSTSTPVPQTPTTPAAITPLLECVTLTGNTLVAWFGYVNPHPIAVTIALGSENVVSPASLDGAQPTRFTPGSQQHAFRLTFSRHQSVSWSLEGTTVTASSASPRC